jgi:DNA-binding MarR family transcriptional regulator
MKQIAHETISNGNQAECAGEILNTIPLIMVSLRRELQRRQPLFSMPQFRILHYLHVCEGPTLSDLAEHIGLRHPTMSKMVESLVQHGWIARAGDAEDRRRIRLELTAKGRKEFERIQGEMRSSLAATLDGAGAGERRKIIEAMQVLQTAFRRSFEADGKCSEGRAPAEKARGKSRAARPAGNGSSR